ncbi:MULTISPECIES: hypothetical protein [unclassified Pseudoclavibacter]|uniref:hypothetical protein n=1 Tax=unclassified Pseudoclavibacter TaxID=2615177 RepID=UPI002016437F|nr:hypothetical protein [Pseudoclavibacter sp. Marseille-Q4354]
MRVRVTSANGRSVQGVPRLVAAGLGLPVGGVHEPAAAEVHAVRKRDGLAERAEARNGVEGATGREGEQVERFEEAAGAVPPVGVALVDGPVFWQHGDVAIEAFDDELQDARALRGLARCVEQAEGGDEHVALDPRVPVVRIPVEAEPVPVAATHERLEDAHASFVADARPHTRVLGVELVAEQLVDPGELPDDFAGAEVEVRVGDGCEH